MIKIKKINISKFILPLIVFFFTVLLILSLPVLLDYNSMKNIIEKKVTSEFKINLKILDNISLKIFPKPHYLIKKANLDLNHENQKSAIIETKNLKIFIPLNKIYSKSNFKINKIEIEKSNIYFKINDVINFRNHLYYKINNPIFVKNSKFFFLDKSNNIILISPINNINYSINKKSNSKELKIKGNIFDIDYSSHWERFYEEPKNSLNEIKLKNPNLTIKNSFSFEENLVFRGNSYINFLNEDFIIDYVIRDNQIFIKSPNQNKKQKIKLLSKIELNPFSFDATISFEQKDISFFTDNLLNIISSINEEYLGNINGKLTLVVNNLKNQIIDNGKINFFVKEKKISLENSIFEIEDIGKIKSDFRYYENKGDLIFASENVFELANKKEFSRKFQVSTTKLKNINRIYFDLEKNIDSGEISISNIYLNEIDTKYFSDEYYIIKNYQVLKGLIRKLLS